jgi:Fur family transcriptional regulator, ferric uptake regulator
MLETRSTFGMSRYAAAITALRAQGLRASGARRLVLRALYEAEAPVTAEQVAGGLEGRLPASDLASVYRNLGVLEQVGLVRHVRLARGPGRYVPADGGPREYAACERCGEMAEVDPAALDGVRAAVRAALGYEARFGHFPLVGLCPDCARRGADVRTG